MSIDFKDKAPVEFCYPQFEEEIEFFLIDDYVLDFFKSHVFCLLNKEEWLNFKEKLPELYPVDIFLDGNETEDDLLLFDINKEKQCSLVYKQQWEAMTFYIKSNHNEIYLKVTSRPEIKDTNFQVILPKKHIDNLIENDIIVPS